MLSKKYFVVGELNFSAPPVRPAGMSIFCVLHD